MSPGWLGTGNRNSDRASSDPSATGDRPKPQMPQEPKKIGFASSVATAVWFVWGPPLATTLIT